MAPGFLTGELTLLRRVSTGTILGGLKIRKTFITILFVKQVDMSTSMRIHPGSFDDGTFVINIIICEQTHRDTVKV